jgi:ribosome-associated protein YbcJ (S4-like RNA binding protein)
MTINTHLEERKTCTLKFGDNVGESKWW